MRGMIAFMIAGFCSMIILIFLIGWYSSLPIVYESWSTGQCVKVEVNGKDYSCRNIPVGRFIHMWVE